MRFLKKPLVALLFLAGPAFSTAAEKPAAAGLTTLETILVDGDATGYATFQSNNRKVIWTKNGIFMTHIRSRNDAYTAQQWRLSRSVDGGSTFSTAFEATDATNPPVIEADTAGNVYLIRPDFVDLNAYLYRFLAEKSYKDPVISVIPGGSGGKYAALLDPVRKKIFYSPWGSTFYVIGLDGTVEKTLTLVTSGDSAGPQYPLFSLAPDGMLHMAWTTVKHNEYLYWDIHHMETPDAGATWRNMDGTKLTLPVKVDDSGPTDRITLDDEFNVHTWLSNFIEKDGKLHFAYFAQAPINRQHYMRYDPSTGKREIDIQPEFKGTTVSLNSLDGFFAASDSLAGGPLYYISNAGGKVGCLASDDNGSTWYDYAVSAATFNPYSVGGTRSITPDGWIIGSFTDSRDTAGKVYFIRIRAGLSKAGIRKSSYGNGTFSAEFEDIHGQPAQVRFSADGSSWSAWTSFASTMTATLAVPPVAFQLKSRMGIESAVFPVAGTAAKPEWKTFKIADGLADSLFLSILSDSKGNVWTSSQQGGVAKWDGFSWKKITTADGLPTNYVFSLAEGKDGSIWFGTYGSGAVRSKDGVMTVYNAKNGMADVFAYAAAVAPDGALWFGSHYNGVSRFDGADWAKYSTAEGLVNNTVMAIAASPDGAMWFGTNGSGLSRFDGKSWTTFTTADGLVSNYVSSLAAGKDGSVWAGHYASGENKGGASRFIGGKWTKYSGADGLFSDYVSAITASPDGDIWFGGYGGASRYDGKTFETFTVADGLGHRWVRSIAVARDGTVWFATYGYDKEGGITRYFSGKPLRTADDTDVPPALAITGNFPNPFNPSTAIEFSLHRSSGIRLDVYSLSGQLVRTLVSSSLPAGKHAVRWNGRDDAGREVSSGVYLAALRSGNTVAAKRMTLMR